MCGRFTLTTEIDTASPRLRRTRTVAKPSRRSCVVHHRDESMMADERPLSEVASHDLGRKKTPPRSLGSLCGNIVSALTPHRRDAGSTQWGARHCVLFPHTAAGSPLGVH